jgi:ribosomal protein L21E
MKKFKSGDRVVMVGWRWGQGTSEADTFFVGKTGTVLKTVTPLYDYVVVFDGAASEDSLTYWFEDELELVEEA